MCFYISVCRNIPNCRPGHKACRTSIDDSRCSSCYDPYYSGGWRGGCRSEWPDLLSIWSCKIYNKRSTDTWGYCLDFFQKLIRVLLSKLTIVFVVIFLSFSAIVVILQNLKIQKKSRNYIKQSKYCYAILNVE